MIQKPQPSKLHRKMPKLFSFCISSFKIKFVKIYQKIILYGSKFFAGRCGAFAPLEGVAEDSLLAGAR